MRLAVFTKNFSNPAYGAARLGAERAAAVFGDEVLHFVPQKGDDPVEQSALVIQALALRPQPDAFVFSPVHPTQVDAAIGQVVAAGIPMIGFVNPIDAAPMVSYVSSDDFQLAQAIAEHLFRHLQGQGRVWVVTGPMDSYTSLERLRGFQSVARQWPGITLERQFAGDYRRDVACQGMAAHLAAHPAPHAVLAANDIMAIGVLDALDAAAQSAVVVGVNAIPQAVEAIAAGRMLATADFNAMQMAYLAAECAARHLRGQAVPARIELPVTIVDRHNCTHWNLPYEQRPVIGLDQLRSIQ